VIAEYYAPERIRREVAAPEGWDGWIVAVEDESVIGAGGGGITQPGVGEIFVLYLDPTRRGEGIGTHPRRDHGAAAGAGRARAVGQRRA
jgi:GNAT superfamily N-acetyltransferase